MRSPRLIRRSRKSPRRLARRGCLESLEARTLLAVTPLAGEQLVNGVTTRIQQTAPQAQSIALEESGDFVVAYQGSGRGDVDGVFARQFAADGTPKADEFLLNATTAGFQEFASLVPWAEGGFIAVWSGRGQGDRQGVFARLFDSSANPLSGEILVNSTTGGDQMRPQVATTAAGGFVVVWSGRGQGDVEGVFMRTFDAAGTALTPEVRVNQTVASRQDYASLAVTGDEAIVAWSSRDQDGSGFGVFARRLTTAGVPVTGEIQVNTASAGDQLVSDLSASADGSFVVTFGSQTGGGAQLDAFSQRFSATTDRLGTATRLSQLTALDQHPAQIAHGVDGTYIATWMGELEGGSGSAVIARQFAADGTPLGLEFVVSSTTVADQQFPSVAQNAQGDVIFVWSGHGAQDPNGVYVRRFTANVEPSFPNRPPDLDPIADQTATPGSALTLTATAADPDNDSLVFLLDDSAPTGATIDPNTGAFSWTPTADQIGDFSITIIVVDSGTPALSDTETFTVSVAAPVNNPPNLDNPGEMNARVDDELTFTATATDPDNDSLVFLLDDSAPAGATIDPNTGAFRWTPTRDQIGDFSITIIVVDSGTPALSDTETFSVSVTAFNSPPDLLNPGDQQTTAGRELVLPLMATDPENDTITFLLDDSAPAGATIDPISGQFRWTPTAGQLGDFSITVLAIDDGFPAMSDTETFTVTVGANRAPQLDPIDDRAANTAEPLTLTAAATDPDGNNLTFQLDDSAPEGAAIDPATGAFSWTPTMSQTGQFTIIVIVTDDGDPQLSDSETFTVTVNASPVAQDDSAITERGSAVSIDVVTNDTDPDGTIDSASVAIVDDAANGTTAINPTTGEITYTPNPGFAGTDTLTYTVDDNQGATSNVATVSIVVQAPPTAVDDSALTNRDESVVIDVVANDTDPDGSVDPTSVTIVDGASNGTTSVDPVTGQVTYTPNTGFLGDDSFTYTVADNDGKTSNVATVSIRVNAPPTAADDSAQVNRNESVVIDVPANDTDPDGTVDPTSVTIVDGASNGTTSVDPMTGQVTYTPNTGFLGDDSFTYTVADNDGKTSNVATVSVVVVNAPPVANPIVRIETQTNTPIVIDLAAETSDPDGQVVPSTVMITQPPVDVDQNVVGTITVDASGVATYTPELDFSGVVTFTYTIQDNDGATSNEGIVNLAIGGNVGLPPGF